MVVTSTDHTVQPWDQEDDVQFFIYDKTRHLNLLEELTSFLEEKERKIAYQELVAASEAQTNATLGLLGSSKGKPIFTVDVSGSEPIVEFVGYAPVL